MIIINIKKKNQDKIMNNIKINKFDYTCDE